MTTFQEFLQKKAIEERQPERRKRREEWIAAVNRLLDQLRAWLAESDPDQVLDIIPIRERAAEPALGAYDVPALKIGIGEAAVHVTPMGRDALGVIHRRGNG